MSNLLRAQLRRTLRGRLFWVELAVAAVLALTILLNGYFGTNLTNAYVFKLVARMFGYAPLMGVFVGLFTAHLWGGRLRVRHPAQSPHLRPQPSGGVWEQAVLCQPGRAGSHRRVAAAEPGSGTAATGTARAV